MKIPHAIAELISEFSGLNRTPDFKAVRSIPNCQCLNAASCQGHSRPSSGTSTPVRKYSGERRHSVNITVGADQLPKLPENLPSRNNSNEAKFRKNRRRSAPCISNISSSTSLKEKLSKLRSANSSGDEDEIKEEDEDFHVQSRKQSVTSYRVS